VVNRYSALQDASSGVFGGAFRRTTPAHPARTISVDRHDEGTTVMMESDSTLSLVLFSGTDDRLGAAQ
jgi:hypothetical protein